MREDNKRQQRNYKNLTHQNGITQATTYGENSHEYI